MLVGPYDETDVCFWYLLHFRNCLSLWQVSAIPLNCFPSYRSIACSLTNIYTTSWHLTSFNQWGEALKMALYNFSLRLQFHFFVSSLETTSCVVLNHCILCSSPHCMFSCHSLSCIVLPCMVCVVHFRAFAFSHVPGTNLFLIVADATCTCSKDPPISTERRTVHYILYSTFTNV